MKAALFALALDELLGAAGTDKEWVLIKVELPRRER
jgi:hypothetical protein